MELLPFEFPGLRDLDHNARVDLVNERDASAPDPVDAGILALDIHGRGILCEKEKKDRGNVSVLIDGRGEWKRDK